jgi:hypothetical protein
MGLEAKKSCPKKKIDSGQLIHWLIILEVQ